MCAFHYALQAGKQKEVHCTPHDLAHAGARSGEYGGWTYHVTACSHLVCVLKLMNCLFLSFSNYFSGCGKPWIWMHTFIGSICNFCKGTGLL
jgi:hypothetical protein